MTAALTREQAQAAAATACAERDTIQANLLDLDGSFGKRLLAGATLTGGSAKQWETTSAGLATLWEMFSAYSAAIDGAAEILAVTGRLSAAKLDEASALLTGASVRLARAAQPLGQRELTAGGEVRLTLAATVREMRLAFTNVAAVLSSAENVWNELSGGLRQVGADLDQVRSQTTELADDELTSSLAQLDVSLRQLRDLLNSDPLSLWRHGQVDASGLDQLRGQAAVLTARAGQLARLHEDADRRIAEVSAVVAAARAAWQDATAARERAAARISAAPADPLPDLAGLAGRLDGLRGLTTAGRWTRLESELDVIDKQASSVARRCREAELAASGLVDRRDELRGLLDAYRAKAAGLGAAENSDLDSRYRRARELLWSAPCDLTAATAAVTGYQQAVLQLRQSGERP